MNQARFKLATKEFSVVLPTDRYLWRLSTADELFKLDTFLAGSLFLSRLDRFGDPREGTLGHKTKSLLDKAPEYAKKFILRAYTGARRQSFASCWHRSNGGPSEYAWREFGGNHNGIAIRTTPRRLQQAVRPIIDCGAGHLGGIAYIDHRIDPIKLTNILNAHFLVRDDYEEEAEARFLVHTYGPHGQQLYGQKGPKGDLVRWRLRRTTPKSHDCVGGYLRGTAILFSVDSGDLIREVVVGRRVTRAQSREIERRVSRVGITCSKA